MWRAADSSWQRNISVFVWTIPLLLGPLLTLGDGWQAAFNLALIVVIAGCALVIGLLASPQGTDLRPYLAFSTMLGACFAGATHANVEWLGTWILIANAAPVVLRGRWLALAGAVVVPLSGWAAWRVEPHEGSRVWTEVFVVLLALLASTAFTRLLETVDELRRTRAELARVAVAEERERFSRDLHDLLGHTLSVMVVKAQAVRRLVATDPDAAAEHAADIERVGRTALLDVRQAVDAMRAPSLPEELLGARDALEAAGIRATIDVGDADLPEDTGAVLAWALREGITNVLRHSGADSCSIEVTRRGDRTELVVVDNGVGTPTRPAEGTSVRAGGLDGLRDRLRAAGGQVQTSSTGTGFRLVASVPSRVGARP
ncbi:sensor histidine kinase [Marmoricola sp. URHB0036]|uniref:sensor histidine kinase n=1 Tax=Marmoricola sp. URHB0036 TaxID=1298863 RepID=UPI000420CDC3|nr:sensor histidine kinase [Marmoricola sp. URHB0036]